MSVKFEKVRWDGTVTFYGLAEILDLPEHCKNYWSLMFRALLHRTDGPAVTYDCYHMLPRTYISGRVETWVRSTKKQKPDEWWINGKRFKGKWLQAYKRAKTQEKRDAILGLWELNQESL